MPRKHRLGLQRHQVDPSRADMMLKFGFDYFGALIRAGILDRDERVLDEEWLRSAWDERREVLMEQDRQRYGLFHRPWAWFEFESREATNDYRAAGCLHDPEKIKEWLLKHPRYLTREEKQALEATKLAMNGHTQEKSPYE
jgi:hypothetical protein